MSRVVFVGNVPYDMTEEQLIEVFSAVGPVAGFRLVFDRESGKPKGFGFCEFYDHETAASAVRNLNGTEVKGRPLRIDLADSDPSLEGKTTYRGELEGGDSKGLSIPPGAPVPAGMTPLDVISNVLGTVRPAQLMEVMGHMKMFVINHPEDARKLLQTQPQLAYALFQAMLMNNIVDPSVLQRMLNASATSSQGSATSGLKAHHPPPPPPTASQYPSTYSQPHHPPAPAPSAPSAMQVPSFPLQLSAQSAPPYYGGPPAPLTSTPAAPSNLAAPTGLDETKKAMLMQVLSLSPAQIQALPPDQRATIEALKAQLGVP